MKTKKIKELAEKLPGLVKDLGRESEQTPTSTELSEYDSYKVMYRHIERLINPSEVKDGTSPTFQDVVQILKQVHPYFVELLNDPQEMDQAKSLYDFHTESWK